MGTYYSLKSKEPVLFECFFAFSKQQFEEGMKKHSLYGKKIYSGSGNLYGTKEGIQKLMDHYDAIDKQIAAECPPQEVYDYEFDNHECCYTNDDNMVLDIIIRIFGKDRLNEVKRKNKRT